MIEKITLEPEEIKYTPIVVIEVTPEDLKEKRLQNVYTEKNVIVTSLPQGYVVCEVLKDYDGMQTRLCAGDIIQLPERRFKTLSMRGLVKKYDGSIKPCNKR